jgi:MFS family permease
MDDLEECCTVSTNHGKEWRAPWYWKWYILGLASLITFGGYYSFDFPSVTHNQLFRHFTSKYHHLSSDHFEQTAKDFEFKFNLLFSLYSMPNTFLPFVGGIAIDKIGNNKVIIVTSSLVLFGNLVQTYGCFTVNMTSFLIGRFIFGLGGEVLQVSFISYLPFKCL